MDEQRSASSAISRLHSQGGEGQEVNMNIALIIAGGTGQRMNQDIPKQFINIYDKPIIIYTLEGFQKHPEIDEIGRAHV